MRTVLRSWLKDRLRPLVRQEVRSQLVAPGGRLHPDLAEALEQSPMLAAKATANLPDEADLVLAVPDDYEGPARAATEFPLPPAELWTVPGDYLELGGWQVERMFDCLRAAGLELADVDSVL